jgi:ribosomal protein S18 acetylase RimI-like enzyme
MTAELTVVHDLGAVHALSAEWTALAAAGGSGALFRGPDWLVPWWHAYHQVLGADLALHVYREDGELVCLAPFYTRVARVGVGLKVREVRLLGDAGPRPPALDILCRAGCEDRAGAALARALLDRREEWDLIDLEPLQDPSRVRATLAARMTAAAIPVDSRPAAGGARRIALAAAGIDVTEEIAADGLASAYFDDAQGLRKGMSALRRLSRLEWADREESSPIADPEASALLEEVALVLGGRGLARLARLDDSSGEAIAAALVVDDGDRAVVLAMAVDPQHGHRNAAPRLIAAEARAAASRGRVALDVVIGATDYPLPPLPVSRQQALRVRFYGNSMARTVSGVRRRMDTARMAPDRAAAGARAAWTKIRSAAANVAAYERLHLYRGELYTRGIEPAPGLTIAFFTEADFSAIDGVARAELIESLELDETAARQKWQRGDVVVLARLNERPAGIAWSARSMVDVPELGRTLTLSRHETYIHDVFVAPHARGRAVAPCMLEFLARELRQRDVYRAWALIGSDNTASSRAFEKAAYTAVCDVLYARLATVDRVLVRPPDAEAQKLLGLA